MSNILKNFKLSVDLDSIYVPKTDVDDALSQVSVNPVQNRAIGTILHDLNVHEDISMPDLSYVLSAIVTRFGGNKMEYFDANGTICKSLADAIAIINASQTKTNSIKLLTNVNLDSIDKNTDGTYNDLPTIQNDVIIDLNGKKLTTSNVFSKANEYGWGDRLFRIQQLDGQPSANVTIKNGTVVCKLPVGAPRTGFLYTESTGNVDLEDLTIEWDLQNVPGGYDGRMCIIGYDGSTGANLTNVKCTVVGHSCQGCMEMQSYDEESHPEYVFNLNNCEFTQKCVDDNLDPYARQSRTDTIIAGGQVTVNINGGRYVGYNTYGTIATFSSGANINISNGAYVESATSTGSKLGPVLLNELDGAIESKFTVNDATVMQATAAGSTSMLTLYSQSGATAGMVSEFIINGGEFDNFAINQISMPAVNRAIINGGTFNKNITEIPNVTLGEGKTCTKDAATGKWIVT